MQPGTAPAGGASQFRGTESIKHTWAFKDLVLKTVRYLCNVDIQYSFNIHSLLHIEMIF